MIPYFYNKCVSYLNHNITYFSKYKDKTQLANIKIKCNQLCHFPKISMSNNINYKKAHHMLLYKGY